MQRYFMGFVGIPLMGIYLIIYGGYALIIGLSLFAIVFLTLITGVKTWNWTKKPRKF